MNSHEKYLSDLKQSKVIHQKRKEQKDKFKELKRNKKAKSGKKTTPSSMDKKRK